MAKPNQSNWYYLIFLPFAIMIYFMFHNSTEKLKKPVIHRIKVDSTRCYTVKEWEQIEEMYREEEDSIKQINNSDDFGLSY